jgi:hypothetical protein
MVGKKLLKGADRIRFVLLLSGLLLGQRIFPDINFVGNAAGDADLRGMFDAAVERIREADPANPALDFAKRAGTPGYVWDIDLNIRRSEGFGHTGFLQRGNDMTLVFADRDYSRIEEIFAHESSHVADFTRSYELFLISKYMTNMPPRYFVIGMMLQEAAAYTEEFRLRRKMNEHEGVEDSFPVNVPYSASSPKPRMVAFRTPMEYYRHLEEWYKKRPEYSGGTQRAAMYDRVYSDFFSDFIYNRAYLDVSLGEAYKLNALNVGGKLENFGFMLGDAYRGMRSKAAACAMLDEYIRLRLPEGVVCSVSAEGLDAVLDSALENMARYPDERGGFGGKGITLAEVERVYGENAANYNARFPDTGRAAGGGGRINIIDGETGALLNPPDAGRPAVPSRLGGGSTPGSSFEIGRAHV